MNRNAWDYLVANAHFRHHGGDLPNYRPADYAIYDISQSARDAGEIFDGDADLEKVKTNKP